MKKFTFLISVFSLLAVSCLKNDIPYPVVVTHILSLDAEGAKAVEIDAHKQTVDIILEEDYDLKNVRINGYTTDIEENKLGLSAEIKGRHDPTVVERACVVVECMVAITVLDALLENMGAQMEFLHEIYPLD